LAVGLLVFTVLILLLTWVTARQARVSEQQARAVAQEARAVAEVARSQANARRAQAAMEERLAATGEKPAPQAPVQGKVRSDLLEEVLRLYERILQEKGTDPPAQRRLAQAHRAVGDLHERLGEPDRARTDYRAAIAAFEQLPKDMPTTPEDRGELLTAVNRLAPLLRHQGQLGEAEQLLDQTQRSLQATWPADVRHPTLRPMVHSFYANRAETQVQLGKHAEAARTAAELPPLEPDAWQAARRAAGFLARCVPLAEQDQQLSPKQRQELAQTYADQASALLREAIRRSAAFAPGFPVTRDQIRVPVCRTPLPIGCRWFRDLPRAGPALPRH
jgi:tetratricopeptide (TPR) repeat protein